MNLITRQNSYCDQHSEIVFEKIYLILKSFIIYTQFYKIKIQRKIPYYEERKSSLTSLPGNWGESSYSFTNINWFNL